MGPKIVVFDLEIMPNLKEALRVWPQLSQFPGKTLKASITSIINAGWKYHGDHETQCINAWDFKSRWKKNKNDDYAVCKAIAEVLKDADAVVTHNGKRFDWKYLQTRLMINKLPPLPTSIKHIDTCSLVKSNLYLFNNRLNTVGKFLVEDEKLDHEGWDLWVKVHEKDPEAMATMEKYCIQDVDLLDKVFTELRPFAKNLPNKNLYRSAQKIIDEGEVCPTCGSENLVGWGWYHTKTDSFQRFRCKDCNATCRGTQKNKQLRSL